MAYPITYEVDSEGVITRTNSDWDLFAIENDSPHLLADNVIGTKLATYISSLELRHMFQAVYERLHVEMKSIRLPFRCDSPGVERLLEMELIPLESGGICFSISALSLTPRAPIHLLNASLEHSHGLISMCSWCKSIRVDATRWSDLSSGIRELGLFEVDNLPHITHGICKACGEQLLREAEQV